MACLRSVRAYHPQNARETEREKKRETSWVEMWSAVLCMRWCNMQLHIDIRFSVGVSFCCCCCWWCYFFQRRSSCYVEKRECSLVNELRFIGGIKQDKNSRTSTAKNSIHFFTIAIAHAYIHMYVCVYARVCLCSRYIYIYSMLRSSWTFNFSIICHPPLFFLLPSHLRQRRRRRLHHHHRCRCSCYWWWWWWWWWCCSCCYFVSF